ncbi:sensor histidine kinase [Seonamhaeicola marinus]|uniref:Sensor histidine kinase n=1 Tax=Seonamhaeicola marinus TaxID=1912246 RepID=A0A5D0JB11_9FLAO|nr:histidine kinase [Seonamhaeicola marinus]TYA92300.1 sensor histidine kinase [Seonamhaeicola marinus]
MESSQSFLKKRFLGIKIIELIFFIGFYLFWAFAYHAAITINSSRWSKGESSIFDFMEFMNTVGVDYILKAILTYPIWWFLFKKLKYWKTYKKVLLHIILLPTFVVVWQQLYYVVCDLFEWGHLRGVARVWDIYIPALFYTLQFGIFHAYNYYLEDQRKRRLESELRNAALKSELSALKAQLNPHFLYNIFNTISASVPAENEHTRHLIAELSDLFRYQLKASQTEKVTIREEIDFVNKYLALEKERFKERLDIEVNVDESIMDEVIPPMLLQPLVENSIKHGLSSLVEGGKITISIQKKNGRLAFEVADTGVGIKDKNDAFEKGIGLTNTKLRLEKMYQTTLSLSDNLPQGLKINFSI